MGTLAVLQKAMLGKRAWWVAPSYPMSEVGWRPLRSLAAQVPGAEIRRAEREVVLPGGGSVKVRSADNPDSLRGEGLDFVVLDECAFMHEDAWTEVLRPALADRQGRALFISTPKGRNWFWHLWQRGQQSGDEWQSWRFTSYDNPFVPNSEIDAAKETLPERVFQQEFMAEFIDDAGGVFRGVTECVVDTPMDARRGSTYVAGVDWGKHQDWTVIIVMDAKTRRMVHIDRFNQIDYAVQLGRLESLAERFDLRGIVVERNSIGDPLVEQLQRGRLPVLPFTTTNATKTTVIDALALAFEKREIGILPDPVLIAELQAFEMERLPSGMLRYAAPSGIHDDCVMALALAWYAVSASPQRARVREY